MQKIKFLFSLVKWWFYKCWVWKWEMQIECCIKRYIQLQRLSNY